MPPTNLTRPFRCMVTSGAFAMAVLDLALPRPSCSGGGTNAAKKRDTFVR